MNVILVFQIYRFSGVWLTNAEAMPSGMAGWMVCGDGVRGRRGSHSGRL
ncbi:hypothetical protein [Edwardsiella ictaluri]|nr:hypothetical protein [Edwardsiella ictaluri]